MQSVRGLSAGRTAPASAAERSARRRSACRGPSSGTIFIFRLQFRLQTGNAPRPRRPHSCRSPRAVDPSRPAAAGSWRLRGVVPRRARGACAGWSRSGPDLAGGAGEARARRRGAVEHEDGREAPGAGLGHGHADLRRKNAPQQATSETSAADLKAPASSRARARVGAVGRCVRGGGRSGGGGGHADREVKDVSD